MLYRLAPLIISLVVLTAATPQPVPEGAGIAIPITRHPRSLNADRTLDLLALDSHLESVKAKILLGFENYEKNTGKTHPLAAKVPGKPGRVGKRTDAVPLTKDKLAGGIWYGTITVGSSGEPFTVLFDTGSSDLILPDSSCSNCDDHKLWDSDSSSAAIKLDQPPFKIQYDEGSVISGEVYNDTVSVSRYTLATQTLGAATTYSYHLQKSDFTADGLMGMAFPSLSSFDASPVFNTLIVERQLPKNAFSFKLSSPGELYIGGSNSELYVPESFTYVPVVGNGFWQLTMDNIQSNGNEFFGNVPVIIDTGATTIVGPNVHVSVLYHNLPGSAPVPADDFNDPFKRFSFPCNDFPAIQLSFSDTLFPIPPESLRLEPVPSNPSNCVSGIVGMDMDLEQQPAYWILGLVFLQNYYTTFDYNGGIPRVGFGQLTVPDETVNP